MIKKDLTLSKKKIHTKLKCPHCNVGSLMLNKKNLMSKQYQSNIDEIHELREELNGGYSGAFPLPKKFIAVGFFICSNEDCKEYVSFHGKILIEEFMRYNLKLEDNETKEVETLTIHSLYPMVHLIPVHEEYPTEVSKLLIESFSLYLEHPSSCVNKLRILVEKILDNLEIKSKNKKGERLTTDTRINTLKNIKPEEANYLKALKWVGNEGSHDTVIKQDDLPKIYEILNKVLDLLYLKSDKKLNNNVNMINDNKGLYK